MKAADAPKCTVQATRVPLFQNGANNSQCLCGSNFRKWLRHVNFIYLFPKWEIQGIHGSGEHLENGGRCAYLLLSTRASEKRSGENQEESTDFTAVPFRAARTPGRNGPLRATWESHRKDAIWAGGGSRKTHRPRVPDESCGRAYKVGL